MNSKRKGNRAEIELLRLLQSYGLDVCLSDICEGIMTLLREIYIFVKRPFWMLSQIIMWVKSERRIRKEEVQRSASMWFVYEMRSNTLKNVKWGLDSQREYVQNFDLRRSLKAARKARLKYLIAVILRTSPEYWA